MKAEIWAYEDEGGNGYTDVPTQNTIRYIRADLMSEHDWQCYCGHWNGANLAHCADCGRKPNEGYPK